MGRTSSPPLASTRCRSLAARQCPQALLGLPRAAVACRSAPDASGKSQRRAGTHHAAAREALLRYVLRPPIAKERVEPQQDGLVRLSLKPAFADGTVAVDMDPLSLLCRLAASVPPPRFHTVKHAGVLASASRPRWRASASDRAPSRARPTPGRTRVPTARRCAP
ncbi:transposase [Sorangium sp. So ce341]|uniref:transposase n=1 Tax=Sorangium sp. So ce341 TaxID=3133302 RepID=UPI003F5DB9D8